MKRSLLIAGLALAVLFAAGAFGYAVVLAQSAKSAPTLEAETAEPGALPAEAGSETETKDVPPPDPNSPLVSDIPGCVCHSDDPKLVEEHAEYRMNQCFACHVEGVPTGQK